MAAGETQDMTIRGQMLETTSRESDGSKADFTRSTYHFSDARASIGSGQNGPHVLVQSDGSPEMKAFIPIGGRRQKDVAELVEKINEGGRVEIKGMYWEGQFSGESAVVGDLRLVNVHTKSIGPDDVLDLATGRYMTGDRSASR